MNELQELREHIRAAGFKSPASHRKVSAYIASHILDHPNAIFKNHVPPLDLVVYAVQSVLSEHDDATRIPDLLDFVTTIEFYRGLALQKANDALDRNERGEERTLTRKDKALLREHQSTDTNYREIYMQLIIKYCELDIYRLVTHVEPLSPRLIVERLCEYFPMLNPYYSAVHTSPRLFHSELSDLERENLRAHGVKCCRFVRNSLRWADAQRLPGEPLVSIVRSSALRAQFPCEVKADDLRNALDYYMTSVQNTIHELWGMFPHTTDGVVSGDEDERDGA